MISEHFHFYMVPPQQKKLTLTKNKEYNVFTVETVQTKQKAVDTIKFVNAF